jgi:hypothetical protein
MELAEAEAEKLEGYVSTIVHDEAVKLERDVSTPIMRDELNNRSKSCLEMIRDVCRKIIKGKCFSGLDWPFSYIATYGAVPGTGRCLLILDWEREVSRDFCMTLSNRLICMGGKLELVWLISMSGSSHCVVFITLQALQTSDGMVALNGSQ